jgi:hypothetical protein
VPQRTLVLAQVLVRRAGQGTGSNVRRNGARSRHRLTLKAGYRALHVDYRNGGLSYDVRQHVPAAAAMYRF